jgi:hypothetical protein
MPRYRDAATTTESPASPLCAVCRASTEQRLILIVCGTLVAWCDLCHQHAQYFAAGGWSISLERYGA